LRTLHGGERAPEGHAAPVQEQPDVLFPLKGAQRLKPLRVDEVVQRHERLHAQAARAAPASAARRCLEHSAAEQGGNGSAARRAPAPAARKRLER